MTSSVPGFKAALTTRLAAALPTVQVSLGHPHPDPDGEELVIVGDTKGRTLTWVASMAAANEVYTVEIVVSVAGPVTKDTTTVRLARAYAIADSIVASVLAWEPTDFAGLVNSVTPKGSEDSDVMMADVRESSVTLALEVFARI